MHPLPHRGGLEKISGVIFWESFSTPHIIKGSKKYHKTMPKTHKTRDIQKKGVKEV